MGCFSWLDCRTGEQIRIGNSRKVYVLIPEKFGGGHITDTYYDGYGSFGGCDIYELVADWNRVYLSEQMLDKVPYRNEYCGLWSYEKEEMEKAGASKEEIQEADEAKRTEYYENALKLKPDDYDIAFKIANLYYSAGRENDAGGFSAGTEKTPGTETGDRAAPCGTRQ